MHPNEAPGRKPFIFLYGPPGSGKSTVGRTLAAGLALPFYDLDGEIEGAAGMAIPEIFHQEGEGGFRERERATLEALLSRAAGVVALGGGALLDPGNRARAEAAGRVLCLQAPYETLLARLAGERDRRPLLSGTDCQQAGQASELGERLSDLLAARGAHYAAFPLALDTGDQTAEEIAWEAQVRLGRFHVRGIGAGYDVFVAPGALDWLGAILEEQGLGGPAALVSDRAVGALYEERAAESLQRAGFRAHTVLIPPGEEHKTIATLAHLWEAFLSAGLERGSPVVALGGGVVGDLAGFAAATFLRGLPWAAVPTSLLAMVDASLGGKTGADLPQGKNLVGAFHPPRLVLADPQALETLPETELRAGLAEVVKAGIIADPQLFARCAQGWQVVRGDWDEIIRRAMAVKIQVIQDDPYERGRRAALNLGHTIGHALEQASGYRLRHGEAIAIGMVVEARLSERTGLAQAGLAGSIRAALRGLGLPTEIPGGLQKEAILAGMRVDKKRSGGKARFALPVRISQVQHGVQVSEAEVSSVLEALTL